MKFQVHKNKTLTPQGKTKGPNMTKKNETKTKNPGVLDVINQAENEAREKRRSESEKNVQAMWDLREDLKSRMFDLVHKLSGKPYNNFSEQMEDAIKIGEMGQILKNLYTDLPKIKRCLRS